MTTRTSLGSLALAVLLGAAVSVTCAQSYPARPVRIISPYPPGGGNDILARAIAQKLGDYLGQQVIVDNRPGANTIIGTELAAKSAPDGYTLVLVPSGHATNSILYQKLPYDAVKDFAPVTLVGSGPLILSVHPSVPVKSVKDLIALAKARPAQLTYASAGNGSSAHLAGALFSVMAGVTMIHIPYKGTAPAVTELLGGHVSMIFGTSLAVLPHVRTGKLRGVANTGAQRSPAVPDIPTVAESGLPGFSASLWYGLLAPAGTPKDIISRLNAEIAKVLRLAEVRERLASQGVDPYSSTPDEFAKLIAAEMEKWAKVVKASGLRID